MELTAKQQTVELIRESEKILLLTHVNPDGDALGSLLALQMILTKLGKEAIAVCSEPIPSAFQFLPGKEKLTTDFSGLKDFVITVNTATTKVDKLGYKSIPEENKLNIVITPVTGSFKPEDVSCGHGQFKYDLVIVLDSPDLERLGKVYDANTELFYETPVINIDHHAGNDYFGKINWVDLTATSTSEILVALVESLAREKPLLDVDVATALLTGIIVDTGSFQNANTTPKSFTVAAQLVAAGAKQQEIIKWVFKTKSLSTLKLWGRILASVQEEKEARFVWSKITKEDFAVTNAEEAASSGIIDELLKTAPNIDFALLLSEKMDGLHGSLRSAQVGIDVSEIAKMFGGGGHQAAAAFQLPGESLVTMQEEILAKIRHHQLAK
ncbi:MAG: DHH family phosphoesterase [Candidatus Berkelbacteria bacterium]|nr:DHH family phosphoesterase [Candidatus Berkelbacteria bacterium]